MYQVITEIFINYAVYLNWVIFCVFYAYLSLKNTKKKRDYI